MVDTHTRPSGNWVADGEWRAGWGREERRTWERIARATGKPAGIFTVPRAAHDSAGAEVV